MLTSAIATPRILRIDIVCRGLAMIIRTGKGRHGKRKIDGSIVTPAARPPTCLTNLIDNAQVRRHGGNMRSKRSAEGSRAHKGLDRSCGIP